jgi:hypothetical protein
MASEHPVERQSLEELLVALKEAEHSDQAFLDLILDSASQRDAELPEVLRAGAIPRTLNATIVGVLRGLPDEEERNRDLLEQISTFRFVVARPDAGLTYHDNTRDALLADWRSTDEKRQTYRDLNEALAAFYEERYTEHRTSERRLSDISDLIARVNPERLQRLTAVIESEISADLLEATYHRLMANAQEGFDFFQSMFFELESVNRVDICNSLIAFTRDFLQRLPSEERQPTLLAWLDYFDARVQRRRPGYDPTAVELVLTRLSESEDLPDDLRTWTLDDLALSYEARVELGAALDARRELTERWLGIDPYNDPLRLNNLGNLYWAVGDYAAATEQVQLAVQSADEAPNARKDFGVFARLDLSLMYSELGDWAGAFDAAIEAFHRARRSYQQDVMTQLSVAGRFAQLLATFDSRATDCVTAEAVALAQGRPRDQFDSQLNQVDCLLLGRRVRTAGAWIERLTAALDERQDDSPARLDLAYRRGRLAQLEGRSAEADEVYSALLDEIARRERTDALRLLTLRRRGANRTTLGDTAGAVADLTSVRDDFARRGCHVDAAACDVLLAEALLKADDVLAARERLDAAASTLPAGTYDFRLLFLTVEGDLFRRLRDRPAADEKYGSALEMAITLRDFERAAGLLGKLAALSAERGEAGLSAEYERRARVIAAERAEADGLRFSAEELPAEIEDGRGIQSFCEPGERATTLDRARQFFESARELDRSNIWPPLNLSVVFAELEDWQGASEALESVLELCPAPMRTPRLAGYLRDYKLEHAKNLLRRGDAARAAAASSAVLTDLVGPLPAPELLETRVVNCVALAVAGDSAAARDSCRTALAAFVADEAAPEVEDQSQSFVDAVSTLVDGVESYWAVEAMLQDLQDEPESTPAASALAARARAELLNRVDGILGLTGTSSIDTPLVTPIIVEIGDGLVPIVDSQLDGGVFLYELIPAMRDRIRTSIGVTVPGVRMRGNPDLPAQGYSAQVDEVPVLKGSVDPGGSFAVRPVPASGLRPAGELSDVHPVTGKPGLWVLVAVGDSNGDETAELTGAQYLVLRIELVIRAHLARYLGPEEVSALVDAWTQDDAEGLVSSVVPDPDARLRLTWVLQDLVGEGVPVSDWRALLTTVREAGGLGASGTELRRAIRARLRDSLPGTQAGRTVVSVPAELEEALLGRVGGGPGSDPEHALLVWLRHTVAETGPAITLVTRTHDGREYVGALARSEDRLITTLTQDELTPA